MRLLSSACCLCIAFAAYCNPFSVFVSTSGNDSHEGTEQAPVMTIQRAIEIAREYPPESNVDIILEDGIYRQEKTIVISPYDSRPYPYSTRIKARNRGKALISGGEELKCHWVKDESTGIYSTPVNGIRHIDQLYVNGRRQNMARFPNISDAPGNNVFDTWKLQPKGTKIPYDERLDPLSPKRVAKWKDPEGAYLHTMQAYLWGDMHWEIKGKDTDSTLIMEGGWQNNRPSKMHSVYRIVENIKEELDAPEEWYFDNAEKRLYYIPPKDVDMENAVIEVVKLSHLIDFDGTMSLPVTGIILDGIEFRQTARTFMENKEPLLRSDWTTYRGGAVTLTGTEDCKIIDCDFNQVGGNAIFVNNYNRRLVISRCHINGSGANGIAFVGNPDCVRSPLFQYGPQDYEKMDYTPGEKCEDFPEDCRVEDCLITMTGRFEKQTAPIQISMSRRITVSACSIYKVPRAGININEGTFGGHIIEDCDIFDTVLETSDHGSFNSWGRDRYWSPNVTEFNSKVKENPSLPHLDMTDINIIRHNRWRCDHGWDIDLDDGSSNYMIHDNVLLSGGLKLREGYNRIVTNNIIINNSLHPHVWPEGNGDVFTRNIVFGAYRPASMTRDIAPDGKWGNLIDYNLFCSSTEEMRKFIVNSADIHSINGDPMFINPTDGDFRVSPDSPALKLGFRNFNTKAFGVRSPRLRAIAASPEIPAIMFSRETDDKTVSATNRGMTLEKVTGDALSAYGIDFNATAYVVKGLDPSSEWAKKGLRKDDLIISINGNNPTNPDMIFTDLHKDGAEATIVRDQQHITVK